MKKKVFTLFLALFLVFPTAVLAQNDAEIKQILVEQLDTTIDRIKIHATEELDDGVYGVFYEHKYWKGFRHVVANRITYVDLNEATIVDAAPNSADFDSKYREEVDVKVNHMINYLLMVQIVIIPYLLMFRMERLHPRARNL